MGEKMLESNYQLHQHLCAIFIYFQLCSSIFYSGPQSTHILLRRETSQRQVISRTCESAASPFFAWPEKGAWRRSQGNIWVRLKIKYNPQIAEGFWGGLPSKIQPNPSLQFGACIGTLHQTTLLRQLLIELWILRSKDLNFQGKLLRSSFMTTIGKYRKSVEIWILRSTP